MSISLMIIVFLVSIRTYLGTNIDVVELKVYTIVGICMLLAWFFGYIVLMIVLAFYGKRIDKFWQVVERLKRMRWLKRSHGEY
ncbi:MAG: hypothetical protein AUK16_03400 [Parcubacteria group bacterium CG2_30_44_11]|nr:MAG: hypothetical protein AUK16_03395 [Parcubacteria group bacterium CG2_30_44_11]OIP76643.1 MAG: hypothetical protein AUK16_03400 [Parcubacteria group bacterium CG2_30_44_11]